jgi:hypothetical protein
MQDELERQARKINKLLEHIWQLLMERRESVEYKKLEQVHGILKEMGELNRQMASLTVPHDWSGAGRIEDCQQCKRRVRIIKNLDD